MYYENMPLNEFFDLYIQERSVDFKERTIDNKRDIFERFISPYFSDTPLVKLTSEDINYWKSVIRAKGYSDSYERLIYNNFRSIFSFAAQHYGVNNPFKAVSPIGSFKRHRLDFWDETTFLEFLSYFKEGSRGYVIFETAYYTGMRLGEILALCRDQIDFSNKIIFVDRTYFRKDKTDHITPPKTESSIREITIPAFLSNDLKRYISSCRPLGANERIFPITARAVERMMERAIDEKGLPKICFHSLRHSHCAHLINEIPDIDLTLIRDRLGHSSITVTADIYGHIDKRRQTELANKLELFHDLKIRTGRQPPPDRTHMYAVK